MQRFLFLLPVPSCLISRQALPQGCFWFPVTCALHSSHIPNFMLHGHTLPRLMAWTTLLYLSGSQLKLLPQEAIVKKAQDSVRCWQGCGTTGLPCWWEYKLIQPLWKTTWPYLPKLNTHLPYDSAVYTHYIYQTEMHTLVHPKTCSIIFIAKLTIIIQIVNNPNAHSSRTEWIWKLWNGHTGPTLWQWKMKDYCYIQQLTNYIEWKS